MKTLNNVDLGKSFQKLKETLVETSQLTDSKKPESYAYAFGKLSMAVKTHLIKCTDVEGKEIYTAIDTDPNDIKNVL